MQAVRDLRRGFTGDPELPGVGFGQEETTRKDIGLALATFLGTVAFDARRAERQRLLADQGQRRRVALRGVAVDPEMPKFVGNVHMGQRDRRACLVEDGHGLPVEDSLGAAQASIIVGDRTGDKCREGRCRLENRGRTTVPAGQRQRTLPPKASCHAGGCEHG